MLVRRRRAIADLTRRVVPPRVDAPICGQGDAVGTSTDNAYNTAAASEGPNCNR